MMPSPRATEPQAAWDWRDGVALLTLLVLAAALRLPTLTRWSIWVDEAFTIHDAVRVVDPPPGVSPSYGPYPLNYLLIGYVIRWWGHGEFAVRIVPCLAGVLTVGALYLGVRKQAGRKCALAAAGLLALLAWHIYWSQNARHYALMLLFATTGLFAGFHAVRAQSLRWGGATALGFVLALLCHPTAVFSIAGFAAFLVWRFGGRVSSLTRRGQALAASGGVVLLAILAWWLFPIFRQTLLIRAGGNLPYVVASLAQYLEIPLVIAAGGGLLAALYCDRTWGVFLAASVCVPLAAVGCLSLFTDLSALYAFAVLPGLCTLAAHAATGFARPPFGTGVVGALVFALVAGHEAGETYLYHGHRHGDRPRWREAAEFLRARDVEPRDVISTGAPALAYHLGFAPLALTTPAPMTWLGGYNRDEYLDHPRPAWFVVKEDRLRAIDPDWRLRQWFARHAVIVATFPAWTNVKDRTIYIYRADPAWDTERLLPVASAAAEF